MGHDKNFYETFNGGAAQRKEISYGKFIMPETQYFYFSSANIQVSKMSTPFRTLEYCGRINEEILLLAEPCNNALSSKVIEIVILNANRKPQIHLPCHSQFELVSLEPFYPTSNWSVFLRNEMICTIHKLIIPFLLAKLYGRYRKDDCRKWLRPFSVNY